MTEPRISDATIAEVKRLCEAATPGPWTAGRADMATIVDGVDSKWIYSADDQYTAVASGRINGEWAEVMANAQLIALARTALPDAIREIKRLREEITQLRLNQQVNKGMKRKVQQRPEGKA